VKGTIAISAFLLIFGGAMLYGAYSSYHDQRTGIATTAKVSNCTGRGGKYGNGIHCNGTWVVGGPLFDGGRVVYGPIENVSKGDVGKTVDVHVHGGRATRTGLGTPILLLVLGVIVLGLGVYALVGLASRRRTSGARR